MYDERARQTLQKPLTARMSTLDQEGYPHTVPVWFMLDGDDVVIFSDDGANKVKHAQRNSKGAVVIGGDPFTEPGYLLKGEFSVEPDNDWSRKITYHYMPDKAEADKMLKSWEGSTMVVLRLKPKKVIKVS
jgi:predicted pyridoxine 5'-phosphate oxidase superfamily flavin-nucleotide-binding protein